MTIDSVAKMIQDTGMCYVRVYRGANHTMSRQVSFCTKDFASADDELTPDRAAQLYSWFMAEAASGAYTVRMKPNSKGNADTEREVVVNKGDHVSAAVSGPGPGGNIAEIEARLQAQFDLKFTQFESKQREATMQARVRELELELKEERQSEGKMQARIGLLAEKGVEVLIDRLGLAPATAAIMGPGHDNGYAAGNDAQDEDPNIDQLAVVPLRELYAKIGPDLITMLRRLALLDADVLRKLAVISDEKVRMAAPFL